MAKLKAHGQELGRVAYLSTIVAVMSDGTLLSNEGHGWKLYRKCKPGVTPKQVLKGRQDRLQERLRTRPAWAHYRELLHRSAPHSERWRLDMAVEMMAGDADGVWSDVGERLGLSCEECAELSKARASMEAEAEFFKVPAAPTAGAAVCAS
jgi:hypothetical protein